MNAFKVNFLKGLQSRDKGMNHTINVTKRQQLPALLNGLQKRENYTSTLHAISETDDEIKYTSRPGIETPEKPREQRQICSTCSCEKSTAVYWFIFSYLI